MKRLLGIMNLILCLELIIGPHFPGTRIFSMDVAKAETCPAGLVMDSTLNRCITSDQQAELINATSSCNGDKECYKRIAEEKLKEAEAEGEIPKAVGKAGLIGTAAQIGAIAGPLTAVLGMLSKSKTGAPSGIAMIAGGLAFTLGNFMADKKHKSCLKKIRTDWEKNKEATTDKTASGVSKVSMSQDQSEAFEMMAKAEDCMKSSAKMKAGFYAAATLAYAASAVLALVGQANPAEQQPVQTPPGPTPAPAVTPAPTPAPVVPSGGGGSGPFNFMNRGNVSPPAPYFENPVKNFQFLPQFSYNIQSSKDVSAYLANSLSLNSNKPACASLDEYQNISVALAGTSFNEDKTLLEYLKLAVNGLKSEFTFINEAEANPLAGIGQKLSTPTARAIIAGVLAGLTAMMWMHANKQAKVAGQRAEFLRNMKKEFDDSIGAISCTDEERSMSGNANCYCYTEGGQRNPSRNNSQVCQQLWSGQTLAQAGNYESLDFSNQRVCIAANGTADENCSCKANQSCLNAIPSMGNLGLGAISVASNGMKPLNDLANGQIGAGSINGAALLSGAARLLDQKNKLANKMKLDPNKQRKIASDFQKAMMTVGAGTPSPLASNSSPLPMNMTPADAARALEKELGTGRDFEKINGSPALAQPGNSKIDGEGFSLGTPDAIAPTENQLAEAMTQDLDYGQSDITKSDSNIFQILTNRYQRSGMRRLFDEDAKAAPEKANKDDISK